MSAITERIDGVLSERGVSKATFYTDCKITSSAYSQWNTGKTEPRPKKLKEVAEYLNVNYTWLIDGTGPKEKAPTDVGKRIPSDEEIYGAFFKGAYSEKKLNRLKKMAALMDDEDDES